MNNSRGPATNFSQDRAHRCLRRLITRIAAVVVFGASAWAQAPDTILHDARIFTSNADRPWTEALAIRGERVITVGTSDAILQLAGANTRVIDLAGRTVVPGFNDAHWHQRLRTPPRMVTVPGVGPSPDPLFTDVLAALKTAAATTSTHEMLAVIVGERVINDPDATRFAVDEAAPDHRVSMTTTNHGSLFNTAALRSIGVGDEDADPVGGWYERVPGSLRLNGTLFGYAEVHAYSCLHAEVIEATALSHIRTTVANALQFGITSIQDMPNGPPKQSISLLSAAGVPIRWRVIRRLPTQPLTCSGMSDWSDPAGPLPPMVTLSGYKWFTDGTPLERLAAMWSPYADAPGSWGHLYLHHDELARLIAPAIANREQLLFHVSGDRAADNLFLALIRTGSGGLWKELRPRLEHGDIISPDQIGLLRELGIIVVHNPTHGALIQQRVGQQFHKIQPIKSLLAAGVPVAFGSDGPMNPFLNIQAAISPVANPFEAVSREQAVIAYTAGSAYAENAEKEKGTLAPGMLADLAVLSHDIFTIPVAELPAVRSVLTMVGGKVVYEAAAVQ